MNNPRSSESSTIFLISSNISLSFWTSSIKSGQGLFRKKSFGSSLACSLVSLSSKFALLYSVNSCLISVDFPTCLAPIIREHLLDDPFLQYGCNCSFNISHTTPPTNLKYNFIIVASKRKSNIKRPIRKFNFRLAVILQYSILQKLNKIENYSRSFFF